MEPISADDYEVVETLFDALASPGDGPDLEMVHPEVVWAPAGPTLRGRSELRDWISRQDRCPIEVSDVFRIDPWVVTLCTSPRPELTNGSPIPLAWAIHIADGLVIGAHGYASWDEALDFAGAWANDGEPRSRDRQRPARRVRPTPGAVRVAPFGRPAGAA